ncbi:MAG: cation transporter [Lachnospiraceae bacterium]|nr:cation transporter [Lachnospiraceae bacterium]
MITLLSRFLIKNREQINSPKVRTAYGILCGMIGIALNLFLFAGKYLAGLLSGSIAVTADALNNLSDAASSVITLAGFWFSGKKADAGHPFGHGRVEYVSGLGVAVLILFMGFSLMKTSVKKIWEPEAVAADGLTLTILAISICVKLYMCTYNRSLGKKLHSEAMKATALDSLSDVLATSLVLICMWIESRTGRNLDGICGLLVAGFVLRAGYGAFRDTLNPLLGEPPSKEFVGEVESLVLAHPEILGVHDLVVHDYGPGRRMLTLHGEVDGSRNVFEIHEVIDGIEKEIHEALGCEAVIHMDPVRTDDSAALDLKEQIGEEIGTRFPGVSVHDFRLIACKPKSKMIFEVQVPYGFSKSNEEIKIGIETFLAEGFGEYQAAVCVEQSYI